MRIIYSEWKKVLDGRYHHDGDGDGWEEPLSLVYSVCHWMLLFAKKIRVHKRLFAHKRMFKLSIIILKIHDRMGVNTFLTPLCSVCFRGRNIRPTRGCTATLQ